MELGANGRYFDGTGTGPHGEMLSVDDRLALIVRHVSDLPKTRRIRLVIALERCCVTEARVAALARERFS